MMESHTASHTGLSGERPDNSKGYTSDNCLPCCKIHNLMRGKLTIDQLLDNIESVAARM